MKLRLKFRNKTLSRLVEKWESVAGPREEVVAVKKAVPEVSAEDQRVLEKLVLGFEHKGSNYIAQVEEIRRDGKFTRLVTVQGGKEVEHLFILSPSKLAEVVREAPLCLSRKFGMVCYTPIEALHRAEHGFDVPAVPKQRKSGFFDGLRAWLRPPPEPATP